jgi:hypothetical protein
VVQQPSQSEHDAEVNDRRENRENQRRQERKSGAEEKDANETDHGAGDIAVIPDREQHRLDVNA